MGVPKFYRWVSERYPNISRVINDNQIPEFDNFYLDMNGIIHACSHVNEENCETNITEEEIFRNIFHYIDFLFRMIKPKKVFFLAVDGVAPRAKMNQQRARRFRAGRDRMKKLKALAEKNNQTLKEVMDHHFDTNSITPGTTFMTNLDEQLKYFINIKLTTDPLWKDVNVHLSGHLTPGEGEHKIMEYIRYTRSQPDYDINTRHCLYGLDADLIMLGLVTHEMHFALLREEVKYGPKKISKILTPEEINWHLLQLCLLRDYINLEFRSIKEKLKFPYDLESIVDDWILMGYLVGNDFIPHLPHLHINQEALPLLWESYKKVLPTLDGYMNESGQLNLARFEIYLKELSKYDYDRFEKENQAVKQLHRLPSAKPIQSELDKDQILNSGFSVDILEKLMISAPAISTHDSNGQLIDKFLSNERQKNNLLPSSASSDEDNHRPIYPDGDDDHRSSDSDRLSENDERKKNGLQMNSSNQDEFRQHKNQYYREKMRSQHISHEQLQIYVQQYIEALQWILKYYYQGCPSWSWFYPHHYAPYLSDLIHFKHLNFSFQRGTPFKPFEQLLGVLPPTSRYLLPAGLQSLMIDSESPLLHFYPEDFQLDQNEKKQDWEAIVLLPFIDEELLLNSIKKYYTKLDSNEQNRNQHKPSLSFKSSSNFHPTTNLLANNPYFPSLKQTRAICTEYPLDFYLPDDFKFKHGRFDENNMIHYPKFPVLNVLPYEFEFKKGVVDLFESRSKSTTLTLNLTHRPDTDLIHYNDQWDPKESDKSEPFQITNRQGLIERYLGKRIFVNWPHFDYGIVCAISDFRHFYTWSNIPGGSYFSFESVLNEDNLDMKNFSQTPIYVARCPFEYAEENIKSINIKSYPLDSTQMQMEYTKAININRRYENRQGVCIGPIPLLLYVCPLIGYRMKTSINSEKCQITMCFSNQALAYPLQTSLFNIANYKQDLFEIPQTIHEYFQLNDTVFSLHTLHYSCMGHVQQIAKDSSGKYLIECRMEPSDVVNQPDIHASSNRLSRSQLNYWTAQQVAEYLQTIPSVISKITGAIIITTGTGTRGNLSRINVGLSWKGNKPVKQLYGYTKKEEQIWLYSDNAVLIISDYMLQFPEIIAELIKKPKEETYPELNIWPERKGRSRLQEVRAWIKKLPTYSMSLIDGAWQILDAPVIKEIDRITKSFYSKHPVKSSNEKTKSIPIEINRLFKPNESFGMCDSDLETIHALYDRVVTVRLGTGVPLGTRGTIIGIMLGQTHLDTYYEVLFDHLPKNSLDAILLGGNNQQCRIKVRSYHLLNYSHSARARSTANYQQSRSIPNENVWEKRLIEQPTNSRQTQNQNNQQQQQQQPTRILKRATNETNSTTVTTTTPTPKSAPAVSQSEKPNILDMLNNAVKEQQAAAAAAANALVAASTEKLPVSQPVKTNLLPVQASQANAVPSQPAPTNALTIPPSQATVTSYPSTGSKVTVPEKVAPPVNPVISNVKEPAVPLTNFPTNPGPDSFFQRAIQESKQLPNLPPPPPPPPQQHQQHQQQQQQQQQQQRQQQQQQQQQRQQQHQQKLMNQSVWDTTPQPLLSMQPKPNEMPIPFQQAWENHSTATITSRQQQPPPIFDPFISQSSPWEPIPPQQPNNTLFTQAIASMSQAPPSSLTTSQLEQPSLISLASSFPSLPQYQQQQPQLQQQPEPLFSILQRAIQQSQQQFSTNQTSLSTSNGVTNTAPFQPFDLVGSNSYPGFHTGPIPNQILVPQSPQQQPPLPQQSPIHPNSIRVESPQVVSSPSNLSHHSPPSQTQTPQQMNSPRISGGSTLQFVPSQVLRNLSKKS